MTSVTVVGLLISKGPSRIVEPSNVFESVKVFGKDCEAGSGTKTDELFT